MKIYLLFVTIIFCLYSIAEESSDFSEKRKIEYIKNQISLILPEGSSILSIEKSEFPGFLFWILWTILITDFGSGRWPSREVATIETRIRPTRLSSVIAPNKRSASGSSSPQT